MSTERPAFDFESVGNLPWNEMVCACESLSPKEAMALREEALQYDKSHYKKRFSGAAGVEVPEVKVENWKDWEKLGGLVRLQHWNASKQTLLVQKVLWRAGPEILLDWLANEVNPLEALLILRDSGLSAQDSIFLLNRTFEKYDNLIALLLCLVISQNLDSAAQAHLAETLSSHFHEMLSICLEILADDTWLMRFPGGAAAREVLAGVCARPEGVAGFAQVSRKSQGVFQAWAELLMKLDESQIERDVFQEHFWKWVETTDNYHFHIHTDQTYDSSDLSFLGNLAGLYRDDPKFARRLLHIWEKKTIPYYGWKSQRQGFQYWFQFLGLLLWRIGEGVYQDKKDDSLLLQTLEWINDGVPSMLCGNEYNLLVCNIFCPMVSLPPEANELLKKIVQKLDQPLLLCSTAKAYLSSRFSAQPVLTALKMRVKLFQRFCNFDLTDVLQELQEKEKVEALNPGPH